MMTAQQLKNSILQRAIEGKLVEQRPEEGTAKELLKQIKLQKEKLVKEGKIKKSKPLPPINEDEIPFDIPDTWEWVRLGDLINLLSGQDFSPDKYSDIDNSGIPYITGASSLSETEVIVSRWTKEPRCIVEKGDLLLVCKGSGYGKTVICNIKNAHIARQIMALKSEILNLIYVKYFLQYNIKHIKKQGQGIIPGIDRNLVLNMVIPLPPLSEQHRIVAKIEELLPLVDRYDKAYSQLTDLNEKFPQDMKKSILQYAIEGKLVEQRSEEGTAADLLKEIKAEKAKLIKEGKIKKSKPLPPITEDEIPFEIPDSWVWVRLDEICSLISDGTHKTPQYVSSGIPFISVKDISKGYLDFTNTKFITKEEHNKLCDRCKPERDDILFCRIGTLGKAVKINVDVEFSIFVSLGLIKLIDSRNADYIKMMLNSGYGYTWIQQNKVGGGTHTFKINLNKLRTMLIPLPPLSEQHRIVECLGQLLPLCDKLMVNDRSDVLYSNRYL